MKQLVPLDPPQGFSYDTKDIFLCVHNGRMFLSKVMYARRPDDTYTPVVMSSLTEMVQTHKLEEFYLIKEV